METFINECGLDSATRVSFGATQFNAVEDCLLVYCYHSQSQNWVLEVV